MSTEPALENDTEQLLSTSQQHGIAFEEAVLGTKGLPRAKGTALFDAPVGVFEDGCALNIKTSSKPYIELADATRVFMWARNLEELADEDEEPPGILFVIGLYRQERGRKEVHSIYEVRLDITNPDVRRRLFGSISLEDVRAIHDGISKDLRPDAERAKDFAYKLKKKLQPQGGLIRLNPKIQTTKNQRRLQCGIELDDLLSVVPDVDKHCYTGVYRGLTLPLVIEGGQRKFSDDQQAKKDKKAAERAQRAAEKQQQAVERDLQRQAQQAEARAHRAAEKEARRREREQQRALEKAIAEGKKELARIQARRARLFATDSHLLAPCAPEACKGEA